MDYVWGIAAVAAVAGMLVVALRLEPHWVSKDGHRFLCTGQFLDDEGGSRGRYHELWVRVLDEGRLLFDKRRRAGTRISRSTTWTLEGRADDQGKRAVYIARATDGGYAAPRMTLRMPRSSRAVGVLDGVLESRR